MEALTEQEQRNRKLYRITLIVALLAVIAVAAWIATPAKPVDLRFLRALKPKDLGTDSSRTYRTLMFTQTPAEVVKLIDAKLLPTGGWQKSGVAPFNVYQNSRRASPSIHIIPGSPKGTQVSIEDPNRLAILP